MTKTGKLNRLAKEKSPYLLQHARNPVDWYPWGHEAFEVAENKDKPIFLSIGYSTCHWCHVMEKESFEDENIARLLNENFVSIKVDREERSDVDSTYMKSCILMTGSGGWPLTIFLTPEKKPFYAGTYFPRSTRGGIVGLADLLTKVAELWRHDRARLSKTAESVTERLKDLARTKGYTQEITSLILDEAFLRLLDSFDKINGGFGRRPKFPSPHNLLFLLRYWRRRGRNQALEMVEETLKKMRNGGIFDHIGFGFHRYATDAKWLVPHFEKMLYDQAMLSTAYVEAYQATGEKTYQTVAEEIFEYVLNSMAAPEGGFFSAEDADSEGQEGKFYLWTEEEIRQILGEQADLVIKVYNVSKEGNFEDEVHQKKTGKNILYLQKSIHELSTELCVSNQRLKRILQEARLKLYEAREKRVRPFRDDKVLTDWNGLMIAALSKGAQAFGSTEYAAAAENAAEFVLEKLRTADGKLLHRYRDGEASIDGNLNDYAFMTWGLIELYETTLKTRYLKEALRLQDILLEHSWDKRNSGFFSTPDYSEKLIVRIKDFRDGSLPSGNSIALLNLIRLARMTGETHYEERATESARAFSSYTKGAPSGETMFLAALDFLIGPSHEIVLVGKGQSQMTKDMLQAIRTRFLPNKVILFKEEGDKTIEDLASFTKTMETVDGKTTAYVCTDLACSLPATDLKQVLTNLGELVKRQRHACIKES